MLSCAGFGDDATLAHALRQKSLAQAVVDFVRPGMQKIFALEIDFRAAKLFSEPPCEKQCRRPASVGVQEFIQTTLEFAIAFCLIVFALQFFKRGHQRLGDVAPSVDAEATFDCSLARLIALHNCRGHHIAYTSLSA